MSNYLNFLIRHFNTNYDIWYSNTSLVGLRHHHHELYTIKGDDKDRNYNSRSVCTFLNYENHQNLWSEYRESRYDFCQVSEARQNYKKLYEKSYYILRHWEISLANVVFSEKWRISIKSMLLIRETIYSQFVSCCKSVDLVR